MIKIEEFSYEDSRKYLYLFQREEEQLLAKQGQMLGADWYECDDENATYFWLLKDIDDPLGFLSYKPIFLDDTKDFIYIVKVYVLENYRGKNPILIEERRVSYILFQEIYQKGINILTLESADDKLDNYYKRLGFEYNEEISRILSGKIDSKNRQILHRIQKTNDIPDDVQKLFGIQNKVM